jgi:membrane associated rhomboid family serine protease
MGTGITLTLIIVILTGLVSYQSFSNISIKEKLLLHPRSIRKHKEYYRFLTHGFVHADWGHLLINMYVLYVFGRQIEFAFDDIFSPTLGKIIFLGLYLGAIVLSSLPSYYKHKHNPYYGALGASGGTSAIVFAYIIFGPWEWFAFPPLPAIILGIGYLWYSSYMGKKGQDNIGHDAHFWGAVFGFVFTMTMFSIFQPIMVDIFLEQLLAGPKAPNF